MNADIRISVSFRGHRKRRKFKAVLGPDATDYLLDLWIGAAVSRPEGILHGFSAIDIAMEAGWGGDPKEFLSALIEVGFIDVLEDGGYALHDWQEHQPFVAQSNVRSERARKAIHARWTKSSRTKGAPGFGEKDPSSTHVNSQDTATIQPEYAEKTPRIRAEYVRNTERIRGEYARNTGSNTPYLTVPYQHINAKQIDEYIHSASDDAVCGKVAAEALPHSVAPDAVDGEAAPVGESPDGGEPGCGSSKEAQPAKGASPLLQHASPDGDPVLRRDLLNPAHELQPIPYLTRRKRKLSGWKLKAFDEFWEAFAYKKGRAEAADAWLDIPELSPELARKIIDAAGREARARPALVSKGQTPKWPQGWLSARRWEDWEDDGSTAYNQSCNANQEVNHGTSRYGSHEEERAEYLESLREAIKRFM